MKLSDKKRTIRRYHKHYMRDYRRRADRERFNIPQDNADRFHRCRLSRVDQVTLRNIIAYGEAKGLPCIITPNEIREFSNREPS